MVRNAKTNTYIKQIGRDTAVYLPAALVPAFVSFISIPIYSRLFEPRQFGYYSIATTTIALLTSVFTGWLSQSSIRFYESASQESALSEYHSTIFFSLGAIVLLSTALLLFALFVLASFLQPDFRVILGLSVLCYGINSAYKVYLSILRASQQSRWYSACEIVTAISRVTIGVAVVVFLGFGIEGILLAFIASSVIAFFMAFQKLKLIKRISPSRFSSHWLSSFFSYGYPLTLALLSTWLLTLANRYVIGLLRGSAEVGLYSVSSQLSEKPLTIAFTGIMLAAYPIIIEVYERKGMREVEVLLSQLIKYYSLFLVPVVVFICVFAREIILVVATAKYADGYEVVPFIAIGIFFHGLSQYLAKGFELRKKTSTLAAMMLCVGLLNIILTSVLVAKLGFKGAGVSLMLSYIVLFVVFKYKVSTLLTVRLPYKAWLKISLAAALMALLAGLLRTTLSPSPGTLALASITSACAYFGFLARIGEIQPSWEMLRSTLKAMGFNKLS